MSQELTAVDYMELFGAVSRPENCAAYVNQATGEVIVANGHDSMMGNTLSGEELIGIPSESELGIGGSALALRFAEIRLPKEVALVRGFFQRRSAYRMFFGLLEANGLGANWAEFQDDAREQALGEWCSKHRLELTF
jgi:hypothetical protein